MHFPNLRYVCWKLRLIKTSSITLLLVSIFMLVGTISLRGQTYLQSQGVSRSTTMVPIENGWVDASNGRLHLQVELGSYAQRGHRTDNVSLIYDSNIWSLSGTSWQPGGAGSWGGWRQITSGDRSAVTYNDNTSGNCPGGGYQWGNYSSFVLTLSDGSVHAFPFTAKFNDCYGQHTNGSGYATDGRGYYMSFDAYAGNAIAIAPDGTTVYNDALSNTQPNEDSNGNYYTQFSHVNVIDTLGRTPVTTTTSGSTIYEDLLNAKGEAVLQIGTQSRRRQFTLTRLLVYPLKQITLER